MTGPVELLGRLPAADEDVWWVEQAKAAVDGSVLFLGAGTGRTVLGTLGACERLFAVEGNASLRRALLHRLEEVGPLADRVEVVAADPATVALGRQVGLVVVPPTLVNAVHDPARRLAIVRSATRHCRPDGRVVLEVIDPYWMVHATLDVRAPLAGGADDGVEVEIRDGGFDLWDQRRSADLIYRFPDGATVEDRFDATALFPRELRALAFQAGLEVLERAVPAGGVPATWRLVCRRSAAGRPPG